MWNSNLSVQNSFVGLQSYLLTYMLSVAAFVLLQWNRIVALKTVWATTPEIFTEYLQSRFADPGFIPTQYTSVLNENLLTENLGIFSVFFAFREGEKICFQT